MPHHPSDPEFPSFRQFADKVGVKAPADYIPICPSCLTGTHDFHDPEGGLCSEFAEDDVPGVPKSLLFFCQCRVTE